MNSFIKIIVLFFIFIIFLFSFLKPIFAADIIINEVYYDIDSSHGSETSPVNEWIELYNKTGSSIDISGWTITDNSSTKTIPNGTSILANGLALISPDNTTWNYWSIDSSVTKILMAIGNGLSNTGDKLILKDGSVNEIDKLSYGANIEIWNPSIPDVDEGHSLERVPGGQDTDTIADFIDQESPTPGRIIAHAPTSTPTPLPTLTKIPTPTSAPTNTPTQTPSLMNTKTPTQTPSSTKTPSVTPSIKKELTDEKLSSVSGEILGESVSNQPKNPMSTRETTEVLGSKTNKTPLIFVILGIIIFFISCAILAFRIRKNGGKLFI